MNNPSLQERLGALRLEFARRLPERIEAARAAVDALDGVSPGPEALRSAYRQFHSLVGSTGTYGYAELSRLARIGEAILKSAFEESRPPSAPDLTRLRDLLVELRNVGTQTNV